MRISVIAPFVAALVYGLWAAFSNWEFALATIMLAGLVQGSFAFISTWLLTHTVNWLMSRYDNTTPQKLRVMLQCSSLLAIIPATMHFLAGTPHIFAAMLPGLVIGNVYLLYLVFTFSDTEPETSSVY